MTFTDPAEDPFDSMYADASGNGPDDEAGWRWPASASPRASDGRSS